MVAQGADFAESTICLGKMHEGLTRTAAGLPMCGGAPGERSSMGRVVAAFAYHDGKRVAEIDLAARWSVEPSDFVWIGFQEPTEADLRVLQSRFGLHELAIEDALHAHQLPKVEIYGSSLFVVLRTAVLEDGEIKFGETHVFVGSDYLITVRHGASASYAPVRQRCEATPHLLRHGVDYVLHAVLDFVVDAYQPVIRTLEEEVGQIEDRIFKRGFARAEIQRIYELRRELVELRRVVAPMVEVCSRLTHLEMPFLDPQVSPYFRDVLDHTKRVSETIGDLREVLSFTFEAALLLESQRQSDVSRQFAAWAAILAVPTAIAGIYGMNFENMPELKLEYGYYAVVGVILLVCLVLFWRFRKAGWL